ncbi:VirB4 family type IV secretion system protein [Aneurinibacillus thermoaerophilus]|jgi:conjugal transfer ATP-binding protein TraC|uniref:VirB4 family type IV secretion system protein n=1 Tax=Aneurinibacillus thermoaerophilus TaxID=143495 RepID=UPI002E1C5E7B|nr:ATP-binding protein [Aneurinibacillus thermoaerophilus]MED0738869.1 ATP-binding protein [Aneurinibacillus thermoaerophilus]
MLKRLLNRRKEKEEFQSEKEYLSEQYSGGFSLGERQMIAPPSIIERIPGEKNVTDYYLEIGNNLDGATYQRTWFMKLTGRTSWVGMLNPILLAEGDANVDLTISIEPLPANVYINKLSQRIAVLQAELLTETNAGKRGAMIQELEDKQGQMDRLRVNQEKIFKTSIALSIGASSLKQLKNTSKTIMKRMASLGTLFRAADTRQLEAWLHTIGIGSPVDVADTYQEMESSNIADMFIYHLGGLSHRSGILIGFDSYKRPVFFDPWHPRMKAAHGVIFGQTGAGKSYGAKIIIRRAGSNGIRVAVVDPGLEYKLVIEKMNGVYVSLSPSLGNQAHRINIYDVEPEEDERGNVFVNLDEAKKAIHAVIFKMIRTMDEEALTGSVKAAIMETTKELYNDFGISTDPNSLYDWDTGRPVKKKMPTLSDHFRLMEKHEDLRDVCKLIKVFTVGGGEPSKAIFDGQSTFSFGNAKAIGISLDGLDEDIMKPIGTLVATKFLTEKFAKKNLGEKKLFFVDEAQHFMEGEEEAKWLETFYRRARKLNVGMWAITQGFEVFLRRPEGLGILKNSPTKLLLKQEKFDIDAVAKKFDLSEGEAQFLLSADQGVGIIKVNEESTIVELVSTPNEHILYTTDPNDEYFETGQVS